MPRPRSDAPLASTPTPQERVSVRNDFNGVVSSKQIALMLGETKIGKTAFAARYTPEPVHLLSFDDRSDATCEEARWDGREVFNLAIPGVDAYTTEDTQKEARSLLSQVRGNIAHASQYEGTVVIDGALEITQLMDFAFDRIPPDERKETYGRDTNFIRAQWNGIFTAFQRSKKNHLMVITRESEIWNGWNKTGIFKPKGDKCIEERATFSFRLSLGPKIGLNSTIADQIKVTFGASGRDLTLEGRTFGKEDFDREAYGNPYAFLCYMANKKFGAKAADYL
jgi:hypothetical protein